jgi:hypothetical protein
VNIQRLNALGADVAQQLHQDIGCEAIIAHTGPLGGVIRLQLYIRCHEHTFAQFHSVATTRRLFDFSDHQVRQVLIAMLLKAIRQIRGDDQGKGKG